MELTLLPCYEAQTLPACIKKARAFIERSGISANLVSDNGSTDGSQELANTARRPHRSCSRARVRRCADRRYPAAQGKFIIMGDGDDSYDFSKLDEFVDELRGGADLVMGNRFKGGISPGAMPPLHRYLEPRLPVHWGEFFRAKIGDFHCGLRGFSRESILRPRLVSPAWNSPPNGGQSGAGRMVIRKKRNF